jgi:hypothetical protein
MSLPYNKTRGVNTSLYNGLSEDDVEWIEATIWLRMTGRIEEARRVFQHKLHHIANKPIIIIERANLEHEAGRWGEAWRILNAALEDLRKSKANLDLPEHRLIALMWAMFGVRHRGDIVSSAKELERARGWLCDERVADFTDIQVSTMVLRKHLFFLTYFVDELYPLLHNSILAYKAQL